MVDKFLDDAIEIDVDALCDGTEVYLGGVMEHIEEAGIHSGDSACVLPPITLGRSDIDTVRAHTEAIALGCGVRGLLNVQYALKDQTLYVLEANPRASRTVPFSSKATAVPLAKAAARIMTGSSIADLRAEGLLTTVGDGATLPPDAPVAVKEAVMPFHRFRRPDGSGVDSLLGPEMRSTGEVMGIDAAFGPAFAKSQTASYGSLPTSGTVFVSVANADKRSMVFPIKRLADLGFKVVATEGTAEMLRRNGMTVEVVRKHFEGPGNIVEKIRAGEIDLVINTPYGQSGPAHRRIRDPHRRDRHRHPMYHHGGRCGGGDPGHRGGDPLPRRGRSTAGAAGPAARGVGARNGVSCSGSGGARRRTCRRSRRARLMGAMDVGYRRLARPVLFRLGDGDAETAHHRTLRALASVGQSPTLLAGLRRALVRHPSPRTVFGLDFPSVVGLAAGVDKDGLAIKAWPALGFGFVELGTVTARPQPGNPRPRLFRLRSSEAVINRMGFNNDGSEALARRLASAGAVGVPVGISLGKSKHTPLAEAVGDYLTSLDARAPPRRLRRGQRLVTEHRGPARVAGSRPAVRAARRAHGRAGELAAAGGRAGPVPVLVKIAPDLSDAAIADVLQVGADHGIAGIIAVNTTLSRAGLAPADVPAGAEPGGLSGAPLRVRAVEVVRFLRAHTDLPVIGVGGISSADDGLAMLDAGADLLQVYTGFIYRGPALVSELNAAIAGRRCVAPAQRSGTMEA